MIDEPLCGILNVFKPRGITSRDVVNQIQKVTGKKTKIGHAGTLDPMADGVLLVCLGRATRLMPLVHQFSKSYLAGFRLGVSSDTDDSQGQLREHTIVQPPSEHQVFEALQSQVGSIEQLPPVFSAVNVQGQRAYHLARQGRDVQLKPRLVEVHLINLVEYEFPDLRLEICCGSGTYIRSIARDLGKQLGCGGLMSSLRRTRIGDFTSQNAFSIETITENLTGCLTTVEQALKSFPCLSINEQQLQQLRYGRRLELAGQVGDCLIALSPGGRFAAWLQRTESTDQFRAAINWVPLWFNS